jgi:hypothetical protein
MGVSKQHTDSKGRETWVWWCNHCGTSGSSGSRDQARSAESAHLGVCKKNPANKRR